jgi:hypothetical protein
MVVDPQLSEAFLVHTKILGLLHPPAYVLDAGMVAPGEDQSVVIPVLPRTEIDLLFGLLADVEAENLGKEPPRPLHVGYPQLRVSQMCDRHDSPTSSFPTADRLL